MKYKEIKAFKTDDDKIFDTTREANLHCDLCDLREEYTALWLNQYLDFDKVMQYIKIKDLKVMIDIFDRIIEYRENKK